MVRSILSAVAVLVTGALLGSFLGKWIAMTFPGGQLHHLFGTHITAGLHPTHLDLRIVEVTFGCLFHFNMMSIIGVVIAAIAFKLVLR